MEDRGDSFRGVSWFFNLWIGDRAPAVPALKIGAYVGYLRIVPLGGLGEIGMNCLALESPDGILVIDCGVTFPHEEQGVDVIHPLFDYLQEHTRDVLGVVVTHGHEDHIGALPYLLRRVPVPVWAPPYALSLIRERLREFTTIPEVTLTATTPRSMFRVGRFEVEPLRVTHSIPDSTALAIRTRDGLVIHTGDFKLEDDPVDGEATDRDRFEALGAEGVSLMLSDSTNADIPGRAGRERTVAEALLRVVSGARHRVMVGMFPSNIHRMRSLVDVARSTGRRLCLLGRSVQAHARAARELGRLGLPMDLMVPPERVRDVPRGEILIIASGTQGETRSALSRLSMGDHPTLATTSGDTLVLSSRAIPGNERAVWDLVCAFERRGIDVRFYGTDPDLHVSGHGCRDEQRQMLDWVQPQTFIPIHGTYHHLRRHAALAREAGVRQVEVIENGETLILDGKVLSQGSLVHVGRVHIDGGMEIPVEVLKERSGLAETGVVTVTVSLTAQNTLRSLVLTARGVLTDKNPTVSEDLARKSVAEALQDLRGGRDPGGLENVREAVRRAVRKEYGHGQGRPTVLVHLQEA